MNATALQLDNTRLNTKVNVGISNNQDQIDLINTINESKAMQASHIYH